LYADARRSASAATISRAREPAHRSNEMAEATTQAEVLHTTAGDFPLHEYRLGLGGREWRILHTDSVLSRTDESHFLLQRKDSVPYGVLLWPAAIALAHEIAARADELRGRSVLELGAGTGLPGIVAASLGARVVQTDKQDLAMSVCKRNVERNGVASIQHRLVDWADWDDPERYDCIIGSDILYAESMHPHLRSIFERSLAPGGRVLLSDPFRAPSLRLLEAMEAEGWAITLTRWSIGQDAEPRPIGLFDLQPPR
jgi:predicted nicotinamide N-methyase